MKSLRKYSRILKQDKTNIHALVNKGLALHRIGAPTDITIEWFTKVLTANPTCLSAWYFKAILVKNKSESCDCWLKFVELKASDKSSLQRKKNWLLKFCSKYQVNPRFFHGLDEFGKLLLTDELLVKGILLYTHHRKLEAIHHFNSILEIYPLYLDALAHKTIVLEQMGKQEKARECLHKLVRLVPNSTILQDYTDMITAATKHL